jgi:hypothetical protein
METQSDNSDPTSVGYRIAQCKACDNLNKANFCKECGCFMPVKVRFKSSQCPIGKWKAIVIKSGN